MMLGYQVKVGLSGEGEFKVTMGYQVRVGLRWWWVVRLRWIKLMVGNG